MPSLPDASLSILASPFSSATAAKIVRAIFGLLLIVAFLYYASPTRLTPALSDAMNKLDNAYGAVSAAGLLGLLPPEDIQTVVSTYQMLRVEVGKVQKERLCNSWRTSLFSVFAGRSVSLLRCIEKVKDFERRLQLLQEDHRNKTNSLPLSFATGVSRSTGPARFRFLAV
ncbi:hypothetical protein B0H16DRAFT_629984 [Mycena metata]|uniref:Uncharacterized protein n=1 Tax=Mycena metata TaxID=1033252 RepID=A0AAD7JBU8_9AGAR|nr:hypothetical protein B0H16DRAFT_629984 [Mycena metata]